MPSIPSNLDPAPSRLAPARSRPLSQLDAMSLIPRRARDSIIPSRALFVSDKIHRLFTSLLPAAGAGTPATSQPGAEPRGWGNEPLRAGEPACGGAHVHSLIINVHRCCPIGEVDSCQLLGASLSFVQGILKSRDILLLAWKASGNPPVLGRSNRKKLHSEEMYIESSRWISIS
jgi:hypothetical protein